MEILEQIFAKQKAESIIKSCERGEHYDVASRYIELYRNRFNDYVGYHELKRFLQETRLASLTPN